MFSMSDIKEAVKVRFTYDCDAITSIVQDLCTNMSELSLQEAIDIMAAAMEQENAIRQRIICGQSFEQAMVAVTPDAVLSVPTPDGYREVGKLRDVFTTTDKSTKSRYDQGLN